MMLRRTHTRLPEVAPSATPLGPRIDARRGGFTLVELLVTAAIIGILAGLAIPNMRNILWRARATELAADMDVVRVAALNYNAEQHSWPAEAGPGAIPTGLAPYLPDLFTFNQDGYDLDYENWDIPGGLPGDPGTQRLIGVSVVVDSEFLSNAFLELLGPAIVFSVGTTHTIVVDRS